VVRRRTWHREIKKAGTGGGGSNNVPGNRNSIGDKSGSNRNSFDGSKSSSRRKRMFSKEKK
jgi:hypothetical protein